MVGCAATRANFAAVISFIAMIAGLSVPTLAAERTWLGDANTDWHFPPNWENNQAPDSADDAFLGDDASEMTIDFDLIPVDAEISVLRFDSASSYTLQGSNLLTVSGVAALSGPVVTHTLAIDVEPTSSGNWSIGQGITIDHTESLVGSDDLNKTGAGKLVLTGNNGSYGGDINIGAGEVEAGVSNSIGNDTNIDVGVGGTLRIAEGELFGGISGAGSVILESNASIGYNNLDATISGVVSGSGALNKGGTGTQVLSGANTYGGSTEVRDGTLLLNNAGGSATGTGDVEVQSGATLGGSGSSSGTTTVLSSGTVDVGDDVGTLTLGAATLNALSTVKIDLGGLTPGSEHDQLIVTNTASIGDILRIFYLDGYVALPGDSFVIMTAGNLNLEFENVFLPDGQDWIIEHDAVNNRVVIQVCPDADGDGVCDPFDACPGADDSDDADNDGVPDGCDACPNDNPDDSDGDGVCDSQDVCPGFDDSLDCKNNGTPDGCDIPSSDALFAANVKYGTAGFPNAIAVGDLDGDGSLDLATANHGNDTVSVLLNNGDGTYANDERYATGWNPRSVAMADFNGDDSLDMVSANVSGNNISVLLNNGDGTFATRVNYGAAASAMGVSTGDLDSDGDVDLAVANLGDNTVSIRLNNGNGTFAAAILYGAGDGPRSVTVSDIDGDNHLDLVVANSFDHTISVLLNNGDGTFAAHVTYSPGERPVSVSVGDLNCDGHPDLAVANETTDDASVLLNNGDGTFAAATFYGVGNQPGGITLGDLNGDGDLDLAVATIANDKVSVFLNNGDGSFGTEVRYGAGNGATAVAVGDLDGDGNLDLAIASQLANKATVLLHLEGDCNGNGKPDECDIAGSASDDCNTNGVPDECDIGVTYAPAESTFGSDCNTNGIPDDCEIDSDGDGVIDDCDPCPSDNPDDSDGDGACDSADLCPGFDDTLDSDGDGLIDGCDDCAEVNVQNVTHGTFHPTIEDAIDASTNGDVIELGACVFNERDLVINDRIITLRGQGAALTIIDGAGIEGRLLDIRNGANVTLEDFTFRNAFRMGSVGGAALSIRSEVVATIRRCRFENNEMAGTGGGAIRLNSGSASVFHDCAFTDNSAESTASAVSLRDQQTSARFVNTLFRANAGDAENAIQCRNGAMELVNCTFAETLNQRVLYETSGGDIAIQNCVHDATSVPEVEVTATKCLYPGATGGNIDGVPTFVDEANGDYRLAAGSLGIDAADYDAYIAAGGGSTDLNDEPRTHDDLGIANTGAGTLTHLEMGAYEFQGFSDTDGDSVGAADDICPNTSLGESVDTNGCPLNDCNSNGVDDVDEVSFGTSADCNSNTVPDECDIASGTSSDADGSGVPDECEGFCANTDVNCDGSTNALDLAAIQAPLNWAMTPGAAANPRTDVNGDNAVNALDLASIQAPLNWASSTGPCTCLSL